MPLNYRPTTFIMNLRILAPCFLAAFIFWLLNALNKSGYTTKISYPITIKYNESAFVPIKPLPQTIGVSLSSTGWELLRYSLVSNVKPLVYEIGNPLTTNQLDNIVLMEKLTSELKNTRLNYLLADTTTISFEKKKSKIVKLKVDSLGIDLRKNFVVSSVINISPVSIEIEGPESMIDTFDETILIKIPTKKLGTNFDEQVNLGISKNPLLKSNIDKVMVSFEVAELLK